MIAEAKDAGIGFTLAYAFFAGLFSFLCLGLVATAILQSAVTNEAKKYGLRPGLLGIPKHAFEAKVEELRFLGRP